MSNKKIILHKIILYVYLQPIRNIAFVTSSKDHNIKIFSPAINKLHTMLLKTLNSWEHLTNFQQTQQYEAMQL